MAGDKANDYRDLRVWKDAMALTETVYRLTKSFLSQEMDGLTSQMRRAAVSIPSNIAEGNARAHLREYIHFLSIAQGSSAELETQAILSNRLGFLSGDDYQALSDAITSIRKQLNALRTALSRNLSSNSNISEEEIPYTRSC